jgi:hypothetical protein
MKTLPGELFDHSLDKTRLAAAKGSGDRKGRHEVF